MLMVCQFIYTFVQVKYDQDNSSEISCGEIKIVKELGASGSAIKGLKLLPRRQMGLQEVREAHSSDISVAAMSVGYDQRLSLWSIHTVPESSAALKIEWEAGASVIVSDIATLDIGYAAPSGAAGAAGGAGAEGTSGLVCGVVGEGVQLFML
jgi:hypothetical protein